MNKERIFGLDALRTIAILTVLIGHAFYLPNSTDPKFVKFIFLDGVNMFFTLSGFLVGSILIKTFTQNPITFSTLLKFWTARWWRTLPLYFFILFLLLFFEYNRGYHITIHYAKYLLFLQNLKNGHMFFGETWSLCIEEWFYLTTPLLLLIATKIWDLRKACVIVAAFIIVAANVIRVVKISHYNSSPSPLAFIYDIMLTLPTRMDAVIYGFIGAYLNFYKFRIWTDYKNLLFWTGITLFISNHLYWAIAPLNWYVLYFLKQMELIFILMTIPKLLSIKSGKGWTGKVITHISVTSYSIYLCHGNLFFSYIQPHLPKSGLLQLPFYLGWAFGVSYLLNITVERWGLRQRENRYESKIAKKALA